MGLVVREDGLFGNPAVDADLEAVPGSPLPDFASAGLPRRTCDLGPWLSCSRDPDRLGDELVGAASSLHGKLGVDSSGDLVYRAARSLTLKLTHSLGKLLQAESADRIVEQAQLRPG
jgi:hypothetical protein